jgi:biopolymer transport protein ExbD/biopolymer transport protein TolR
MRSFRIRPTNLICRIDMTAFLSIQLVLLFTFIALVNVRPTRAWISADLPKVTHPIPMRAANREDAMVIAITLDGQVWLGNDRLALDQLPTRINEAVGHGAERKVYILADGRARYGGVLQVLAVIRSAGIENVGFLADKR